MRINYTKIVATLGPSSDHISVIESLVQAGVDVVRLNFSHGSYLNFKQIATNVRKAAKKHDRNVSLLQDLQGPKIRLGTLPKTGVKVHQGDKIILSTGTTKTDLDTKTPTFPVQYKGLHKDVKKGSKLFIDDGMIQVEVIKITGKEIHCALKTDGILFTNKGINAPGSYISAKPLTEKDKKDLKFGLALNVEYIALSFVRSAKDITDLRALIHKHKKSNPPKIIAKIEREEALKNIEEIIQESDGIMIARGDLGVEIKPELVPIVQKSIIKLCNRYSKPVITATQVLSSMIENPRPTRAEISDAANATYDGTDAIMLSNETAVGKYPHKSVQTLSRTISAVENELKKHPELLHTVVINKNIEDTNATALSASELALHIKADKIVIYTRNGFTAQEVMKHRVYIPSIVVSPDKEALKQCSLVWGVNQVLQKRFSQKECKNLDRNIITLLKANKLVKKGEKIVIVYSAQNHGSVLSLTV